MRDSSAQAISVIGQRIDRLQRELPNIIEGTMHGKLRNNPCALG